MLGVDRAGGVGVVVVLLTWVVSGNCEVRGRGGRGICRSGGVEVLWGGGVEVLGVVSGRGGLGKKEWEGGFRGG